MEGIVKAIMPMVQSDMKRSGDVNAKLDKFEEGLANPPGGGESDGGYGGGEETYSETPTDDMSVDEDPMLDLDSDMTDTETPEGDPESTEDENPDGEDKPAE
jgi:hypothetical protein